MRAATGPRSGRIVYEHAGSLYLNLTNRCPTACSFCVKEDWGWTYRGQDLLLGREPAPEEIWGALVPAAAAAPPAEFVFCGYGEPTYRLPDVLLLAARLRREFPGRPVRLNTIGLGALICRRDVVPELAGRVDAVSVSLNTADPEQWQRLHRPAPAFREMGFAAALAFAVACARAGLRTTLTAIERPDVDLDAVARLAAVMGAAFRRRPPLALLAD